MRRVWRSAGQLSARHKQLLFLPVDRRGPTDAAAAAGPKRPSHSRTAVVLLPKLQTHPLLPRKQTNKQTNNQTKQPLKVLKLQKAKEKSSK